MGELDGEETMGSKSEKLYREQELEHQNENIGESFVDIRKWLEKRILRYNDKYHFVTIF